MTLAIAASVPVGCDIELFDTEEDIDFIRRHTAQEACRKLGRKLSTASIPALIPEATVRVDDVTVFIVEFPLPLGACTVAFACLEGSFSHAVPAGNHPVLSEVAL